MGAPEHYEGEILRLCQAKEERALEAQGLSSCGHERLGDGKEKWRGSQRLWWWREKVGDGTTGSPAFCTDVCQPYQWHQVERGVPCLVKHHSISQVFGQFRKQSCYEQDNLTGIRSR